MIIATVVFSILVAAILTLMVPKNPKTSPQKESSASQPLLSMIEDEDAQSVRSNCTSEQTFPLRHQSPEHLLFLKRHSNGSLYSDINDELEDELESELDRCSDEDPDNDFLMQELLDEQLRDIHGY